MTLYLVHVWNGGSLRARAVEARTPQAAARKIAGSRIHLDAAAPTSAGAVWVAPFTYGSPYVGSVEWPREDAVRLVHYPHRPSVAPWWTVPDQWLDGERHPIAVLEPGSTLIRH